MATIDHVVRELRGFVARKEVLKQLRKEIREPVPAVRKAIKASALDTLPKRGGLNVWASKTRVTAVIRVTSRSAVVRLRGSRKSPKGKSDLKRLDLGKVRHPSWGRRGRGQWHNQAVTPYYFGRPVIGAREWRQAVDRALDSALRTIRRG